MRLEDQTVAGTDFSCTVSENFIYLIFFITEFNLSYQIEVLLQFDMKQIY